MCHRVLVTISDKDCRTAFALRNVHAVWFIRDVLLLKSEIRDADFAS